ncbi:MAG: LamG domain-containing protein [Chitinophagaceae bacterium]|nr:LamG domain-containing protein [Chitinophagaceae bacterium]
MDCGDPADNSFELTGDATIEAWVKANIIPPTGGLLNNFTIVSKSAGAGNNYWVFGLQDGRTMFSYGNSGVHVYSGLFDLDLSKYYHVALVKSGSNVSFYINGKLSQTVSGINSVPDVPGPLTIGYGNTFFNCNMNGNIDELRFWGTALSKHSSRIG